VIVRERDIKKDRESEKDIKKNRNSEREVEKVREEWGREKEKVTWREREKR
jgi:hypothetical protein